MYHMTRVLNPYVCVRACVHVRAFASACVRASVCVHACVRVCVMHCPMRAQLVNMRKIPHMSVSLLYECIYDMYSCGQWSTLEGVLA